MEFGARQPKQRRAEGGHAGEADAGLHEDSEESDSGRSHSRNEGCDKQETVVNRRGRGARIGREESNGDSASEEDDQDDYVPVKRRKKTGGGDVDDEEDEVDADADMEVAAAAELAELLGDDEMQTNQQHPSPAVPADPPHQPEAGSPRDARREVRRATDGILLAHSPLAIWSNQMYLLGVSGIQGEIGELFRTLQLRDEPSKGAASPHPT
ncbi:hypothetical protein JCM10296v2_003459 [Rhodotorula toruloides]